MKIIVFILLLSLILNVVFIQKYAVYIDDVRFNAAPSICVVLTSCNVASYVNQTINSIRSQTYKKDVHYVLIDDASTDETVKNISKIASLIPSLTVYAIPSRTLGGVATAANIGIDYCIDKGFQYVGFMDMDDVIDPQYIEQFVNAAKRYKPDVMICDFDVVDRSNNHILQKSDSEILLYGTLPKNTLINVMDEANALTSINPAPWRKMISAELLQKHTLRFPEYDTRYEDNMFHWNILLYARTAVVVNQVLAHHRVSRSVNPSDSSLMIGYLHIFYSIRQSIMHYTVDLKKQTLFMNLFTKWLGGMTWVLNGQTKRIKRKATKIIDRIQNPLFTHKIQLSIITPCYNSASYIGDLLLSYGNLIKLVKNVEFLFSIAPSNDKTAQLVQHFVSMHKEAYALFTNTVNNAGTMRNRILPLAVGQYVMFMDSDDTLNPAIIKAALIHSIRHDLDLLILPYATIHVKKTGREYSSMVGNDDRVFESNDDIRLNTMSMVNYPWNKLYKLSNIQRYHMFFGPTIVQNDVQFFWMSLIAAQTVKLYKTNAPAVYHNIYEDGSRIQLTKMSSGSRLEMIFALQFTHRAIMTMNKSFCLLNDGIMWKNFVYHIFQWAKNNNINQQFMQYFLTESQRTIQCINTCSNRCLSINVIKRSYMSSK